MAAANKATTKEAVAVLLGGLLLKLIGASGGINPMSYLSKHAVLFFYNKVD
jgi:hypothetical protein